MGYGQPSKTQDCPEANPDDAISIALVIMHQLSLPVMFSCI